MHSILLENAKKFNPIRLNVRKETMIFGRQKFFSIKQQKCIFIIIS